ncbi:MAG: nucleoside-diphosphate kinase, partial [Candidatus Helarchaeota archaeon]|nr:nucleoside-diphosphate kinase [Candidatus Helarchaeota archaeon]
GFQEIRITEELARKHYQEHEGKPFFPWLVKSIRSAPVLAMIVQGNIQAIRSFLGATFVQKADPSSVRGKYGIWGGVNSVHASDSPAAGARELELWNKFAQLQKDPKAIDKIKSYIKKWIKYKNDSTVQLRQVCKMLSENHNLKDETNRNLIPLLKEDCPQIDDQTIRNFIDVIIENVLL